MSVDPDDGMPRPEMIPAESAPERPQSGFHGWGLVYFYDKGWTDADGNVVRTLCDEWDPRVAERLRVWSRDALSSWAMMGMPEDAIHEGRFDVPTL